MLQFDRRPVVLTLVFGLFLGTILSSAVRAVDGDGKANPVRACLDTDDSSRLAVLFVIDESKSLRGKDSDPENRRVDAMKTAISALAVNLGIGISTNADAPPIDVAFGGFGRRFSDHGGKWTSLTSESLGRVLAEIDQYAKRNNEDYTNYEAALVGAERKFVQYDRSHTASRNCKVLVWFSDGTLDLDNRSNDFGPEERLIGRICAKESGVVDRLRGQEVFSMGFGLATGKSASPGAFALMSDIVVGECGGRKPSGVFTEVTSADALIREMFQNLTGSTPDTTKNCEGEESDENCREVRFTVRAPLDRINALVGITPTIDSASVIPPEGSGAAVDFVRQGKVIAKEDGFLNSNPSYDQSTVLGIKVSDSPGVWKIQFRGAGARSASVFSVFFSDVAVKVDGLPLELDRRKPEPVQVSLGRTSLAGLDGVQGVEAFDSKPSIRAELVVNGQSITARVLETVPDSGRFKILLESSTLMNLPGLITLQLTPTAAISGHQIVFSGTSVPLTLRLGDGFPRIRDVKATNVDGSGRSIVTISLSGPEEGSGTAAVKENSLVVSDVPAGHETSSPQLSLTSMSRAEIPTNAAAEIEVQVKPKFAANGSVKGSFAVELKNSQGESQIVNVPFSFIMTKPFESAVFAGLLLTMLLLFVLMQTAVLMFASDRLSRIGAIPESTWWATFRIKVRADNSIDLVSPSSWSQIAKERAYPIEAKAVSKSRAANFGSFCIEGSRKAGLRALVSAEEVCLDVSNGSSIIVTSMTVDTDQPTVGRLRPMFAGQWAVAVSTDAALRIAQPSNQHSAESSATSVDPWKSEFYGGATQPGTPIEFEFEADVLYFFKDFNPASVESLGRSVQEILQYGRIRGLAVSLANTIGADEESSPAPGRSRRDQEHSGGPDSPSATPARTDQDSIRNLYG